MCAFNDCRNLVVRTVITQDHPPAGGTAQSLQAVQHKACRQYSTKPAGSTAQTLQAVQHTTKRSKAKPMHQLHRKDFMQPLGKLSPIVSHCNVKC
jgi:hypothetical protein